VRAPTTRRRGVLNEGTALRDRSCAAEDAFLASRSRTHPCLHELAFLKRRVRLLHVAGVVNSGDFVDSLLRGLDTSIFDIHMLVGEPPRRRGCSPSVSYGTTTAGYPFSRRHIPRLAKSIHTAIQSFSPDILHAHHFDENVAAALVTVIDHVPVYVIGRHYSDHVYTLTTGVKRRALLAVEAFCNWRATTIIVPTEEVRRLLVERQRVPASKVTCIPYALDLEGFRPSAATAVESLRAALTPDSGPLVVACCRLNHEKGLDLLLRAQAVVTQRHPRLRVALVGEGPARESLERLAAELGTRGRVIFAGWQTNVADWLAAADVVVQPSYSESYCQVLIEALSLGRAFAMTPVGAAPEVIGRDERGVLIPRGDAAALAVALERLVSEPELRARLGSAGRQYVETRLQPAQSIRRHEQLYLSTLRQTDRP